MPASCSAGCPRPSAPPKAASAPSSSATPRNTASRSNTPSRRAPRALQRTVGYHCRRRTREGRTTPMPDTPEAILEGRKRPFTGAEYLQSLRDGREVYIYGERVADVTTHPALRNAAVSVAKLYDALHDANSKGVLTGATDTGSG